MERVARGPCRLLITVSEQGQTGVRNPCTDIWKSRAGLMRSSLPKSRFVSCRNPRTLIGCFQLSSFPPLHSAKLSKVG